MKIHKFIIAILAWFLLPTFSWGQKPASFLQFSTPTIDLGEIRYDSGVILTTFVGKNTTREDIVVLSASGQCKCIEASFSREPIRPAEEVKVTLKMNPEHLFAAQSFPITVLCSDTHGNHSTTTITLKAYVVREQTELEVRYPLEIVPGVLRSGAQRVMMSTENPGGVALRQFVIYNSSSAAISLGWFSPSKAISVKMPTVLGPGEEAKVVVSVNTKHYPSDEEYNELLYISADGHSGAAIPIRGFIRQPWTVGRPPKSIL